MRGIGAFALVATMCGLAAAQDARLPTEMRWSAYGSGADGYNQALAIAEAFDTGFGVGIEILPLRDVLARTEALRRGASQFAVTGIAGSFLAQEGVFGFANQRWGPQPVRIVLQNDPGAEARVLAVAAELCDAVGKPGCVGFGYADLAGRRVAWIPGDGTSNTIARAHLAYGGLDWPDVDRVSFAGTSAAVAGVVDGTADAVVVPTRGRLAEALVAGPRGAHWPELDPRNRTAMAALSKVAPFLTLRRLKTNGAPGTDRLAGVGHPDPVLVAMADLDAGLVAATAAAMDRLFPRLQGRAPGIEGWALSAQYLGWVVPFHAGAVEVLRDAGLWTAAAEAHNTALIERQAVLRAAWTALEAEDPPEWEIAWRQAREAALTAAGYDDPFAAMD